MIYNWDEENIDLFADSANTKGNTEEEKERFLKELEDSKTNAEKLKELTRGFGWNVLDQKEFKNCVYITVDRNDNISSLDFFDLGVSDDEYEKLKENFELINSELKESKPLNKVKYFFRKGILKRLVLVYKIAKTWERNSVYDYKLEKVYCATDCYHISDFEKIVKLKSEKTKLYNYLNKHKKCFWQLKYPLKSKKRKIDIRTINLYERIDKEVEYIINELGE